jgi:hypothetical protein
MKLRIAFGNILTQGFRFWRGETTLNVFGPMETMIGIIIISVLVSIVDMFVFIKVPSITVLVVTCILWIYYFLALCLATAFLLSRLIPKGDFKQALTMAICVYWVIPFVPLFSLLPWEWDWGLGPWATVPAFGLIPTFSIDHNYLPLGMLVVIPFIVGMASRFMARTTGVPWGRVFAMTLVGYALIYIYFYQWGWQALFAAMYRPGYSPWETLLAAFTTYSFVAHVITLLLLPVIYREYHEYGWYRLGIYLLFVVASFLVLLLIPRFGFFPLFLAAGQP